MRLLCVSQYYWPEPFNVADICEELVGRGNDVTVLTGVPNYPDGIPYQGYNHRLDYNEEHNGVNVIRCKMEPRRRGAVGKIINYYSFARNGTRVAKNISMGFDVIMAFQFSPVMSAMPAISAARSHGVPLLIYVLDIWPESLLAGGISRDSAIYRHFTRISKRIYSAADRLAVTSPLFKTYIEELLGHEISSFDLPQFAEDIFDRDDSTAPEGYPPGRVNLTFAGNIGAAQSVQTIVRAASMLRDTALLFHIVGSGSELESCMRLADELRVENIVFHGRHSLEEMPAYYNASDAMLVTFSNSPILGYTLPRKIQSYMAAGKPILGTLVGESRRVIDEAHCGLCCDAEDYEGLASACREFLCLDDATRSAMGSRARRYNEEHFSRNRFFETLERALTDLKESYSEHRS